MPFSLKLLNGAASAGLLSIATEVTSGEVAEQQQSGLGGDAVKVGP